jgi:membrane fusion protein (multidrug efflux system)
METTLRVQAGLFTTLILACTACSSEGPDVRPEEYPVIAPIVSDAEHTKECIAEIHSVQYVEVRSRLQGHVERIHVDEGQLVEQGQLLFTISGQEHRIALRKAAAALEVAKAELKAAEVELKQLSGLVEKEISSRAELEILQARVDALRARRDEAAAQEQQEALYLSFAEIRAPYRGRINRIPHKVGSLVHEEDILTTISDNSEVFAYFHLAEVDYLEFRRDGGASPRTVQLMLPDGRIYEHVGTVETAESEFDAATGNIAFRARFPNPEGLLKQGANGKVVVVDRLEDALLVPQRSTYELQDKQYVLVVGADSIVQQREINTSMRMDDLYVVQHGLRPDERIVFEGVQRLKHGDRVSPKLIPVQNLLAQLRN